MAKSLELGRESLHLLLLFPRQADLGTVSGVSDWENPGLSHSTGAMPWRSRGHKRRGPNIVGKKCAEEQFGQLPGIDKVRTSNIAPWIGTEQRFSGPFEKLSLSNLSEQEIYHLGKFSAMQVS